jgi:acetolactate decarboxylase
MRKYCLFFLIFLITVPGATHAAGGRDVLFQVSTIDALMTGIYDGETTLGSLKEKGDFGLGTFNALDGEMILLDGRFYRITAAGTVERPDPGTKTPFAAVTFFDADRTVPLEKGLDFRQFVVKTDKLLPTPNVFYAIKITGTFEMVRARSVARQTKPYRPLDEVVKNQRVFNLSKVEGTIVGFRCPPYVKGVNVPGYHLHFITADRKAGGHVLDFKVEKAVLEVDDTSEFNLVLPSDKAFYGADLTPDREQAVKAVEK